MTPQEALKEILAGRSLDRAATEELFGRLMDGELSDILKSALLVALAMKGEAPAEIAGAAAAMRRRVLHIPHGIEHLVDTCGTGGDGKGGFNVSTCAALVAAAAGAKVAKHGNRSVSSRSGSSDLLAALGVVIDLSPEDAARALHEVGIAFLFAPRMHPAMKEAMPVRRELGVRTLFNLLGPITNPAGARRQVVGVYAESLVATIAEVLRDLGAEHALVVHGDGYDEITTTGITRVAEVKNGKIEHYALHPRDFGLAEVGHAQVAGGTPEENAATTRRLLAGAPGPLADLVALNSGAALYVAGIAPDLKAGVVQARKILEEGDALKKLDQLIAFQPSGISGMQDLSPYPLSAAERGKDFSPGGKPPGPPFSGAGATSSLAQHLSSTGAAGNRAANGSATDTHSRHERHPGEGRGPVPGVESPVPPPAPEPLPDILARIVAKRRERLAEAAAEMPPFPPLWESSTIFNRDTHPFLAALASKRGGAVIAEVKMGSPRLGSLEGTFDPLQQARDYARGGAAALSVVVEPDFFFGSYSRLAECAAASGLPAIAKDFVVDPLQLSWASEAGAAAVLLIAALYDAPTLHRWARLARGLGLVPLVELNDEHDLAKLAGARWELVGVNNRNLRTFAVELENSLGLLPKLPAEALKVAESGIHRAEDLRRLRDAGFDAYLIGESLLTSGDPVAKLAELLGAP